MAYIWIYDINKAYVICICCNYYNMYFFCALDFQKFEKETEVTPCVVFLDRLTQGTLQKEAEYYHNRYFEYENTFILIHDVNSGKTFVTAFGKYAQRIGEKAGVFELGEKMTQEKAFSKAFFLRFGYTARRAKKV